MQNDAFTAAIRDTYTSWTGVIMTKFFAYGMGAALVDTELSVSDDTISRLGINKGLMTLVRESEQSELKLSLADALRTARHASGGSAGNSMIAISLFGAPTYMCCKVAADEDGAIYLRDLESCGVAHGFNNGATSGTTGKCLVLITPDAERTMNTFLGVSEELSISEINESAIGCSDWIYLEGYLVTSSTGFEAALQTRAIAAARGVKTALSFSDPSMVTHFRDNIMALVADGIDLIFCNELEAVEWSSGGSLESALAELQVISDRFVVTRGEEGAFVFDGSAINHVEARSVNAINTNGAGDMFAGAFLYALSQGEDALRAAEFASLAAAEVVQVPGPRLTSAQCQALKKRFFREY